MQLEFYIPGEPKAKQRPRFGGGFAYTPKETVNYENWVKSCFIEQCGGSVLEGEVEVEIFAYFSIPKSTSKKKRHLINMDLLHPTKKPDCDNIAKIVLDSLNGIAYKDDSQVVNLEVHKKYDDSPRVEVIMWNKE